MCVYSFIIYTPFIYIIYAEWLFVADCIFLARQTNPIHLSGQWSSPEGRNYVDDDDIDDYDFLFIIIKCINIY